MFTRIQLALKFAFPVVVAFGCSPVSKMSAGSKTAESSSAELESRMNDSREARRGECLVHYEGGTYETPAVSGDSCGPEQFGGRKPMSDDDDLQKAATPVSGVDEVPVRVPPWCGEYRAKPGRWIRNISHGGLDEGDAYGLLDEAMFIAVAACDRQRYRPRQEWVAHWLQQWLNTARIPLKDADALMSTLIAYVVEHESDPENFAYVNNSSLAGRDWTKVAQPLGICSKDPWINVVRRWRVPNRGRRWVCGDDRPKASYKALDALEVDGRLHDLHRLMYWSDRDSALLSDSPLQFAEAKAIQWDRIREMLNKHEPNPVARFVDHIQLPFLQKEVENWLHGPNPPKAQLVEEAYKNWRSSFYEPNKAILNPALVLLRGRDKELGEVRNPKQHCSTGFRDALAKELRAAHPTTLREATAVIEQPLASVLVGALAVCEQEKAPLAASVLAGASEAATDWLGPRHAAMAALQRKKHGINYLPSYPTQGWTVHATAAGSQSSNGKQLVTFATESRAEEYQECVETNKIDGISATGRIIYRENCWHAGTDRIEATSDPLDVINPGAKPIRKGHHLLYVVQHRTYQKKVNGKITVPSSGPRPAFVVAVFENEKETGLTQYLGFDLGESR